MNTKENLPDTIEEYIDSYVFEDKHQVYTNGSKLVPLFRVKDALEHYRYDQTLIKNAKWIIEKHRWYPICSNCRNNAVGGKMTFYCPYCGAKMKDAGCIE